MRPMQHGLVCILFAVNDKNFAADETIVRRCKEEHGASKILGLRESLATRGD